MSIRIDYPRSPPDGKSSPVSEGDALVIIPGFISRSRHVNVTVPSWACAPVSKSSSSASQHNFTDKNRSTTEVNAVPSTVLVGSTRVAAPRSRVLPVRNTYSPEPGPSKASFFSRISSPRVTGNQPYRSSQSTEPHNTFREARIRLKENHEVPSRTVPKGYGSEKRASDNGTQKRPYVARETVADSNAKYLTYPEAPGSPDSPNFDTSVESTSTFIAPAFIKPLNLCDPFTDSLGLSEICSIKVNELSYLTQTNHNKPVGIYGRTYPSFLVRIWSRGSGKYMDILSVGEVYGRGVFGQSEQFRLILIGNKTVLLQSTKHPRLYIGIQNGLVTGKGYGGENCHFMIHQAPTGYCLFESALSPRSFLGVRKNGNIMRPFQVDPNTTEARFVIQKESLGPL